MVLPEGLWRYSGASFGAGAVAVYMRWLELRPRPFRLSDRRHLSNTVVKHVASHSPIDLTRARPY